MATVNPVKQIVVCHLCGAEWSEHEAPTHIPACPNNYQLGFPKDEGPVKSDGGSSSYYFLPEGATELNDLIEAKQMSFARGNIFKALYRLGNKVGTDVEYDLNKIELFLGRLREMHRKGIPL